VSIAGRTRILLLVLLAAGSVVALATLLVRRENDAPAIVATFPADPAPSAPAASGDATSGSARTPESVATTQPAPFVQSSASSGGVIRGEVLAAAGVVVPARWTLHVGPHPWLAGHEKAADRRIAFEHGETTFEVRDLPLGGYLVEAIADGLNCLPGNVMLVRGSEDQFVTIQLSATGAIDGGVLDSAGRPASDLAVTLESATTGERRTETTDAGGNFVFRSVRDGEYRIFFGRPDSPLLPPQLLAFQAPSMRFPTRTLPPTGTLDVSVLDVRQRPIANAMLSGSASKGGAIDTQTDANGTARIRYLAPGEYRIDARTTDGLRGSTAVALGEGQEAPVRIVLRDPKERP
jgi:hypothetical protein